MRIVHMLANDEVNGAAIHCLSLASQQAEQGHEVLIAASGPGYIFARAGELGIARAIVPELRPELDPRASDVTPPSAVAAVRAFLVSIHPDLVHTHLRWARNVAVPASQAAGIATVHTQHDEPTINAFMADILGRLPDVGLIASSSRAGVLMADVGIDSNRIRVVPNGVAGLAPSGWSPEPTERPQFLLAARLVPEKGWDTALEAMDILRRDGVSASLIVAGDGWQRDEAIQLVKSLELDEMVQLAGVVNSPIHLSAAYRAVLVPSRTETSPLVILEAMSAGIPVIASDVGDIAILLKECALSTVVASDDAPAFARAMRVLAEAPMTRDVLARRHFESAYTQERLLRDVMAVYDEVLARRHEVSR